MFGISKPQRHPRPGPREMHRFCRPTMGTQYSVAVGARADQIDGLGDDIHRAATDVDCQMSTWKPDSDLSGFNRHAVGEWFPVPGDLALVVSEGLKISNASRGAFDMTVGATVNAWGFGPVAAGVAPEEIGPPAGFTALEVSLDPPMLRKTADFLLDLSGIAKGFCVDKIAGILAARAITDYIITIDGEVRIGGRKPDGTAWSVGVEAPVAGSRQVWDIWEPGDIAVATSGIIATFARWATASFRTHSTGAAGNRSPTGLHR